MNKVYNGEISHEEAVSGQRKAEDTEIDWAGKPMAEQPDTAAAGMSAQTAPRADITDDGNFRMVDYGDTDTQRQLTQELHDQMVADGTVVQIASREDVAEHYPDLRGVKKQERNAILKGKIRELKQQLRSFLQTLRPNTYEFEVDGNVLEARIYDTAIREVTDRLTEAKSNMLYQSEEIFNNVRYLYSTPDYEGNPDIYRWNYFYTPVQIGDDVVGVRIAVRDMVESGESQIYHWGIKSDRPLAVRGRRNQSNPSVSSSGRSNNSVTQDSTIVNPSAAENSADTIDRAGKPARTERKNEVTNGTERTQSMHDGGGRDAGLDPGVEGRGVEAGGPQRTADAGGKGSRAADRRADLRAERINDRIARFGGLTQDTTAAELIGSGDPESYLAVVPKNLYEEGMRRAAADAESMGASVTYVTGMLRVKGTDGEYHSADAVYDPQRRSIIAKADSVAFEGEQLVDHEVFHHLVKETPALVQQLADEIRQSFSEAEFNAIVERYMQVYRGATGGDLQKVQEEVLADAYAGMNRFRNFDATKYTDTVRGMTGQTDRSAIGRENVAAITRRGVGDDGKFSIVEPFTDENGKQYENAVLLDTDFFDGISPRNWGRKLKQYVENRAETSPFIMTVQDENGNSQTVQFADKLDRVKKDGNIHRVLPELYVTSDNISKLAVIHIDEIAEISAESNPYYTGESSHGWLDEHGWLHRNANVINARNGAIYNITLDIAKTRDGRTILYATKGKIKKVGSAEVHSLKIRGAEQNPNFGASIHQNVGKSQEKFSTGEETTPDFSLAKSEDTEELTAANNLSEADLREALISGAITLSDESDTGSISIVYPKGAEHPDGTVSVSDIQKVILPNYSALGIFRDLEDMGIPNEYYGTDGEYSREQLVNRALGRENRQTASEARQAAARRFDQERIDSLMRDAEQAEERRTAAERKAEETQQKKIESMKNSPDAMRQRVGEALESYLESKRPKSAEGYASGGPFYSTATTLSPREAVECLEAVTGSPWVIKRRRDGTWKAVQQEGLAIGITMPREEALSRLENAKRGALSTPALQCGNKVYTERPNRNLNKQLDFLIENRGHPILCVNLLYSENLLKC